MRHEAKNETVDRSAGGVRGRDPPCRRGGLVLVAHIAAAARRRDPASRPPGPGRSDLRRQRHSPYPGGDGRRCVFPSWIRACARPDVPDGLRAPDWQRNAFRSRRRANALHRPHGADARDGTECGADSLAPAGGCSRGSECLFRRHQRLAGNTVRRAAARIRPARLRTETVAAEGFAGAERRQTGQPGLGVGE